MKQALFVDTGYWLALLNKKDHNHSLAKSKVDLIKKVKVVISDFIIFETITFLNSSLKNHTLALLFLDFIQSLDNLEIIEVGKYMKSTALEIFEKYNDKSFSFTDCVSFAVMEMYNIDEALSYDVHFKQMGFRVVE